MNKLQISMILCFLNDFSLKFIKNYWNLLKFIKIIQIRINLWKFDDFSKFFLDDNLQLFCC